MSNREFTATRTMLANAMATAGAELLEYMGVSSALAAIPNTEPPQYVVAGTLAMIAKVLPAAPVPPLTAPAPLTDELQAIDLWDAAKAEAAMYVEAHCVDGETHARHIMEQARPKFTSTAAPPPDEYRSRIEEYATRCGWIKGGDEGAIEYVSRASYERGLADAAPAPQQGELNDERIKEMAICACVDASRMSTVLDFARCIEHEVTKAAPAAPVQTADQGEPTMLWDAEDSENCYGDGPEDFANNYASNCMMAGEEAEVDVLCAYRGHNRTMRIVMSKDDDADKPITWSWVGNAPAVSLAAPVQVEQEQAEPVAWALKLKNGGLEFNGGYGMFKTKASADDAHRCHLGSVAVVPLYTAPALPAQAEQAAAVRADYSIRPVKVERDENGWWSHPGIPNFDEDAKSFGAWIKAVGLETTYKTLESEGEDHPAYVSYFALEDPSFAAWTPTPPEGEGWFTFSIHDTEDGPVWAWARALAAPSTATSTDTGALGDTGGEA